MKIRRALIGVLAASGLFALLAASLNTSERLVWNATASAPIGLYWVETDSPLAVGDYLAVRPAPDLANWLAQRGYVPKGALLIKRLAALSPSAVCRTGDVITIDGAFAAQAERTDRAGRPLAEWRGCHRLEARQLFLLNPAAGSLDGRYFGPLDARAVVGRAVRLRLPGVRHDA